jgi:hypothetical protein|tara:strand:- start:759 stop:866 length:108 start_codon:yes stop_codon:yes gene_type:complete
MNVKSLNFKEIAFSDIESIKKIMGDGTKIVRVDIE